MRTKFFHLFILSVLFYNNSQAQITENEKTLMDAKVINVLEPEFNIKVGEIASYSGKVHNSVGIKFNVEYNADLFEDIKHKFKYKNPGNSKSKGGDAGVRTYYFKALKAGEFEFTVNNRFRGKIRSTQTIKIIITE